MRTFIALELSKEAKQEIKRLQELLPEFYGKLTEPENLHLTLKFLGDIEEKEAEEIIKRLGKIKFNQFEVELREIGVFSESFIRIIWIHLKNCEKIQEEVDNKLEGLFAKENRFMSHVTIARVKNVKNREKFIQELSKIKTKTIKFKVENIKFKKSTLTEKGPVYQEIFTLNLL